MNHRRTAERSPGDENWCSADVVVDDLVAVEEAHRIDTDVAIDLESEDERAIIPADLGG